MIEIEGLVLSYQDYKEKDAIIHVLTSEKILSVYCRGVQGMASKNRRLTLPFSKVRLIVEHKEHRDLDLLIKGTLIHYYYAIQESLIDQSICFVLNDALMRTKIEPDDLTSMESLYRAMEQKQATKYTWACLIMARILKRDGLMPEVQACVSCHSKTKIETVSIEHGGFLCSTCNQKQFPVWKKSELMKFRALFVVKDEQYARFFEEYHYDLDDFLYLGKWYEHYSLIELASLRFLRSISTLEKA